VVDTFLLGRDEAVLAVVDIQERLAAVMKKREQVVANCLHLIAAAGMLGMPVIVTEQYPRGLGPTVDEIKGALPSVSPVEKIAFSSCEEPGFMEAILRTGRRKVILAGMETHICVLQTCLGLLKQGYHVHLVRDAVCSRAKDNFLAGIEMARDAGAAITSTETVLFQLLERAGTEEFKAVSRRIK
jgi:nicotinamidase-related amidase